MSETVKKGQNGQNGQNGQKWSIWSKTVFKKNDQKQSKTIKSGKIEKYCQ